MIIRESSLVDMVPVSQTRYDELLRKEALLDTIEKLHGRMTEYVFRDAVGYLLNTDGQIKGVVDE